MTSNASVCVKVFFSSFMCVSVNIVNCNLLHAQADPRSCGGKKKGEGHADLCFRWGKQGVICYYYDNDRGALVKR
jgi:hypothetical protein